ncbi:hypothetical protein HOD19_01600 [bacterium]|jgi:hypothetical protein|nr:hypothetical protein [bacterium]MBT4648906.1 hypothetical protein [bacterium]
MIDDKKNPSASAQDKKKIIWVTVIILVIIGLLWWFFSLRDQQSKTPDEISIENQPVFETNSPELELVPPPAEASVEFTVSNLAKTFIARFGSWSTDNQGENLQQLLPLATVKMQNYINNIALDYQRENFYGVNTKSLAAEIKNLDEENGQAEILVNAQRIETNNDLEENVFYQEALVDLVNYNGTWLVDQVVWQ